MSIAGLVDTDTGAAVDPDTRYATAAQGARADSALQAPARSIDWTAKDPVRWTDGDTVTVAGPGYAYIEGVKREWTSDLVWDGTKGTAPLNDAAARHIYLYWTGSAVAIEVTATTPAYSLAYGYWASGTDTTRRRIGIAPVYRIANSDATHQLGKWVSEWDGHMLRQQWITMEASANLGQDWSQSDWVALTAGAATTPTEITLPYWAPGAIGWDALVVVQGSVTGTDSVAAWGPAPWDSTSDTGGGGARDAWFVARLKEAYPAFLGVAHNMPMSATGSIWYEVELVAGTGPAYMNVQARGYSLIP
jgi:hypothetical protein